VPEHCALVRGVVTGLLATLEGGGEPVPGLLPVAVLVPAPVPSLRAVLAPELVVPPQPPGATLTGWEHAPRRAKMHVAAMTADEETE
jgi:hypothetical protein